MTITERRYALNELLAAADHRLAASAYCADEHLPFVPNDYDLIYWLVVELRETAIQRPPVDVLVRCARRRIEGAALEPDVRLRIGGRFVPSDLVYHLTLALMEKQA